MTSTDLFQTNAPFDQSNAVLTGQVTLAQEAEVMFSIKRELSQLREQNKELHRSLSASEEQINELKCKKQVPKIT